MALFGWQNVVEDPTVSLTASSFAGAFGPDMLRIPMGDPSVAWQTPAGNNAANLLIVSPVAVAFRAALLARTNLSRTALMRVYVGAPEAFVEATALARTAPGTLGWTKPGSMTVARSHSPATAMATTINSAGQIVEVAQNVVRISHDPVTLARLGWLQEPRRENLFSNPRFEGAVAGTPGTAPTDVTLFANNGLAWSIAGEGTLGTIGYVDLKLSGTATGNSIPYVSFPLTRSAGFLATDRVVMSVYHQLLSGTPPTTGVWRQVNLAANMTMSPQLTSSLVRTHAVFSFSAAQTTAQVRYSFNQISSGTVVDFTFRLFLPQPELVEAGALAVPTSPILPAIGSPAATVRGWETATMPLTTGQSSGALYVERRVDAIQDAGQGGTVAVRSAGAMTDYASLREVGAATPYLDGYVVVGGTATANLANSTLTLGATRTDLLSWATGLFTTWANGVQVGQVTSGVAPTVAELYVGSGEAISYIRDLRAYPALTDAQAVALAGSGSTLIAPTYDSGTLSSVVAMRQALHVLPAGVSGRAMKIYITDTANPDGFINIPLVFAGPCQDFRWAPSQSSSGVEPRSDDVTTRGGVVIPSPLSKARSWQIGIGLAWDTELAWLDEVEDAAAARRNILFVPRLPPYPRASAETVYGLLTAGRRGFLSSSGQHRNWSGTISERL